MKKQTLSKIRKSIQEDYLPENWHEFKKELVETSLGYYAIKSDCVYVEESDCYYHRDNDDCYYALDEVDDVYIEETNSVDCIANNGNAYTSHKDNCVYVRRGYRGSTYYHKDYLSDNDIIECADDGEYYHMDSLYYWDSDDQYHLDEEESDYDEDNDDEYGDIFSYDSSYVEKNFVSVDKQEGEEVSFGWGVEIEKSEMPKFYFNKYELYDNTGAVIERDGSVDRGFELKTPVYNLMSPNTDKRIEALKDFCEVKGVENAGGHIGFSMTGKTDAELMDLCSGFIPLIFAMYKKRLNNDYCKGKRIAQLKKSHEKMQSIRMRGGYIEFRVIASVKTFNTLKFRLEFFRIMAKNLGKNFSSVIGMAVNKDSDLHKLLTTDIYSDNDKFERLITDAIEINRQFGKRKLTQKSINKITNKLNQLKCVSQS